MVYARGATTTRPVVLRRRSVTQCDPRSSCRYASPTPCALATRPTRPPNTTELRVSVSESAPTLNHVERRWSSRITSRPDSVTPPISRLITRCERLRSTWIAPNGTPRRAASICGESENGPHACTGESASYGSGTDRRYGTSPSLGHTSRTSAVRPPEVEKKYVVATCPPYMRIFPSVCVAAYRVPGVSAPIPPYTWLRSSANRSNRRRERSVASAYDRAATACASSAASGHRCGISSPITPRA